MHMTRSSIFPLMYLQQTLCIVHKSIYASSVLTMVGDVFDNHLWPGRKQGYVGTKKYEILAIYTIRLLFTEFTFFRFYNFILTQYYWNSILNSVCTCLNCLIIN